MKKQRGFERFEFIFLLLIAAMLAFAFVSPFYFCPQRWAHSGLSAEYFFGSGCMVKRKDGTMVPEKAIRDVNL